MKICNPKNLIAFLEKHDLKPKKNSSQNFLIDGNVIRKIVKEADISADDLVIEIGPGPGALTEALLETGCSLWAIEKDPKLAELLHRLAPPSDRFAIFSADFLDFPLEEKLKKALKPGQKAKVVANLPYHITSPILSKLMPLHSLLSDLVLMMQKEVAIRCLAQKGSKDYGSLSLFLQFFSQVTYGFTIEPACFYPKPSIQSSIIHFRLLPPKRVSDEGFLFLLIRTSFQQRRKTMKASLRSQVPSLAVEQALIHLGLSSLSRPEQLSLQDFIQLSFDLFPYFSSQEKNKLPLLE